MPTSSVSSAETNWLSTTHEKDNSDEANEY